MKASIRVTVIGLILLSCLTLFCAEWTVRWPFLYDGWNPSEVRMAVDGTTGIYTLSHSDRLTTLDKWSPSGQKLWSRVLGSNAVALTDILIEPGGSVWAGAFTNVYRFSPNGDLLRQIQLSDGVRAIALGSNSIFVSTYEHLRRYSLGGGVQWTSLARGGERLVVDSAGNAISSGTYFGMPWTRKFSSAGSELWYVDFAADVAIGPADSIAMALLSTAPFYEVKSFAPNGTVLWQQRYVAPIPGPDRTQRVVVDSEGNLYATGSSGSGYSYGHGDILTLKYSSAGELRWVNRLKVSVHHDHPSLPGDIAISSNGLIAVTGPDYFGADGQSLGTVTVLYDGSGNRVWIAREPSSLGMSFGGQAVAFDPDGNVYVAGTAGVTNGVSDYFLTRHAKPLHDGLPVIWQAPTNVLAAPGDDVVFSANASGAQHWQWLRNDDPIAGATNVTLTISNVQSLDAAEFAVAVSNSVGTVVTPVGRLWFRPEILEPPRNYNLAVGDFAGLEVRVPWNTHLRYEWLRNGVVISNATNSVLFVTNNSDSAYGDYTVRIIDPFGAATTATSWIRPLSGVEMVWSQRQYDASEPIGVVSVADGAVFMAGNEFRNGQPDYFILKRYEASGAEGVRTFYAPGRDAFAVKLLAGVDGDLYVAGNERSPDGDWDFLLVRFDTNGAVRGEFRWDSGQMSDDSLAASVQDGDGAIYLVGTAQRSPTSNDVVVLKIVDGTNATWSAVVPPVSDQSQFAVAAAIDSARNLYVGADVAHSNDYRVLTLAFSPQGNVRWRREWAPAPARVRDIAVADNAVVSVGQAGVVKYDADGNERWSRRFMGNGRLIDPATVFCAPDGAVYLAGAVTARLDGNNGAIQWLSTAVEYGRRLVFDGAAHRLYVVASARDLAALRAGDGLAFWRVAHGDKYGEYPLTLSAALHVSGDLVVTSQARDGNIDSLTRRFHSQPTTFPLLSADRTRIVRGGDVLTIAESSMELVSMTKRWHRNAAALSGETSANLTIGPVRSIDGALYSLETWDDIQALHFPAWNVVFQPSLRTYDWYITETNLYVHHDTELPEDATVFLQVSTNLVDWVTVGTNDLRLSIPRPTDGTSGHFFRLVLP